MPPPLAACASPQETFGAMAKTEKIAYILEQVRLCLDRKDYVRAQVGAPGAWAGGWDRGVAVLQVPHAQCSGPGKRASSASAGGRRGSGGSLA